MVQGDIEVTYTVSKRESEEKHLCSFGFDAQFKKKKNLLFCHEETTLQAGLAGVLRSIAFSMKLNIHNSLVYFRFQVTIATAFLT